MWKLSSYGRNIEIEDGRHIIRHAVFKERQMPLTLSVVTEKVVISPFRSDGSHLVKEFLLLWANKQYDYGSHIQFHDDGCIAGHFQCH